MFADEVAELVGQPVRVVWADFRKGCHLRGYLVLAGVSSERLNFRGRSMALQLERHCIVSVEPENTRRQGGRG